jgi:hypothetical protein
MITYTDSLGVVLDTAVAVQPTQRANVEVETHNAGEIDTGSKLTIAQTIASHVPHRAAGSPR